VDGAVRSPAGIIEVASVFAFLRNRFDVDRGVSMCVHCVLTFEKVKSFLILESSTERRAFLRQKGAVSYMSAVVTDCGVECCVKYVGLWGQWCVDICDSRRLLLRGCAVYGAL